MKYSQQSVFPLFRLYTYVYTSHVVGLFFSWHLPTNIMTGERDGWRRLYLSGELFFFFRVERRSKREGGGTTSAPEVSGSSTSQNIGTSFEQRRRRTVPSHTPNRFLFNIKGTLDHNRFQYGCAHYRDDSLCKTREKFLEEINYNRLYY